MNKLELESLSSSKQWEWLPCHYDVKRVTKDTETTWNLSPSITLKLPTDTGHLDPVVHLNIDQSRPFNFTAGLGWNWHKSWNLPDIGVELEITDPKTQERLAPPQKIYCKLQVVKPTESPMKTFHLLEVGVKGNQKVDMENGKCVFSGLKFNTTSYNNNHQKFHIVITLFLLQNKFEYPQILESRISPPIFVDSRKSARDVFGQKIEKLKSYFDPFPPCTLEKQFKNIKPSNSELIRNSIDGLINYFSAPNIRHKVKHPLFLAMKFSNCIKLYLNSLNFSLDQDPKTVLNNIQYVLYKSSTANLSSKPESKAILLVVESGNTLIKSQSSVKKIMEFLEPLNNDSTLVMIDPVETPKQFVPLEDIETLQTAYEQVYETLQQYRKEEDQFEQEIVEQIDQLPNKKKKKELKEPELITSSERIRKIIHVQGAAQAAPPIEESSLNSKAKASQNSKVEQDPGKHGESQIKQEAAPDQFPPQMQLEFKPPFQIQNPLLQLMLAMQNLQQPKI